MLDYAVANRRNKTYKEYMAEVADFYDKPYFSDMSQREIGNKSFTVEFTNG